MAKFLTVNVGNPYKSISNVTAGSAISTTGIQFLTSVSVSANTFSNGDVITIEGMVSKSSTLGTLTPYFYWNTTASLSGAILIGTSTTFAASTRSFIFYRRINIVNVNGTGVGTIGANASTASAQDVTSVSGNISNLAINWTVGGHIILASDHTNSGESLTGQWIRVSNF